MEHRQVWKVCPFFSFFCLWPSLTLSLARTPCTRAAAACLCFLPGCDVSLQSWEPEHFLLVRDILRCKWAKDGQFGDEQLWHSTIAQCVSIASSINEKESQLAAGEILAGLLRAFHHFAAIGKLPNGISTTLLAAKLGAPLLRVMQQCPLQSEEAWCSALRSGLAHSDPANLQWFTRPILSLLVSKMQPQGDETNYVSPEKQTRPMRYGGEVLLCFAARAEPEWRYLLESLTRPLGELKFRQIESEEKQQKAAQSVDERVLSGYLANNYRSVRAEVGVLLAQIVRCLRSPRASTSPLLSIYDCTRSNAQFSHVLSAIEAQHLKLWQAQSKEKQNGDEAGKKFNNLLQTLVCVCGLFVSLPPLHFDSFHLTHLVLLAAAVLQPLARGRLPVAVCPLSAAATGGTVARRQAERERD